MCWSISHIWNIFKTYNESVKSWWGFKIIDIALNLIYLIQKWASWLVLGKRFWTEGWFWDRNEQDRKLQEGKKFARNGKDVEKKI